MNRGFSNQSVERTGMSRSAQWQLQRQWRLIPVAHLTSDVRRSYASMEISSHSPSGGRTASSALLVLVFLFHCATGFILYRGRVVSRWPVCDSDLIIFYAPFVFALAAYASVLFSSPWLRPRSVLRGVSLAVLCFILVFLSNWCYMVLALNTYGS